ncbi:hypothetical protein POSPLADRAFT_1043258 [Postia placenta MAD-698-R-SB12]|uniref:Uncharacterized protein n=1 Tax=Postia placenta MAD-698-R-SB12 TaxID=670580 RepID=A0A1X6NHL8_9APHY|nr:hypothetical protein POSPLADRAFT_1043258 [Postia placenta MAD-698-R-SB12]OSX68117.1 hypothetical protein POSPLADRAFT_1043258 [Postia placenta MAD-698-R-SB12]
MPGNVPRALLPPPRRCFLQLPSLPCLQARSNVLLLGHLSDSPKPVYRTGSSKTPRVKRTGPESYRKLKQARGVFGHKLNVVWKDTSFVSSPMATGDEKIRGPVMIWIGVRPDSLNGEDAFGISNDILDLLAKFDIDDVEVEYRESVYKRSAGPALLRSVSDFNATVDVRGPLTPALGLPIAASDRQDAQGTMTLYFAESVKKDWGQRNIGCIHFSPAIAFNVGPGGFTKDWGAFELDCDKFKDAFRGNCTEIPPHQFTSKMYPRDDGKPTFKYLDDRPLQLGDIITEERMRDPDTLNHNNEACLLVIKNGSATGVIIGRATGVSLFVRDDETGQESMAWAIYNYDNNSGAFSAPGDSGSIIVDGLGRIGGLLTGGTGKTETSDVTTPPSWRRCPPDSLHASYTVSQMKTVQDANGSTDGAYDFEDAARVKHIRIGVWDLYEERKDSLRSRIPGAATLVQYKEIVQCLPYIRLVLNDMLKIRNGLTLLWLYALVQLLLALIPAASLWSVQTAVEIRTVDKSFLLRVFLGHTVCTVVERLLSFAQEELQHPMKTRLQQYYQVHIAHARARLDVPTFGDAVVERQLDDVDPGYFPNAAWSTFDMMASALTITVQTTGQVTVLIRVLKAQPGGLLIAAIAIAHSGFRLANNRSGYLFRTGRKESLVETRTIVDCPLTVYSCLGCKH